MQIYIRTQGLNFPSLILNLHAVLFSNEVDRQKKPFFPHKIRYNPRYGLSLHSFTIDMWNLLKKGLLALSKCCIPQLPEILCLACEGASTFFKMHFYCFLVPILSAPRLLELVCQWQSMLYGNWKWPDRTAVHGPMCYWPATQKPRMPPHTAISHRTPALPGKLVQRWNRTQHQNWRTSTKIVCQEG